MAWFDIALIVILALSTIFAFFRGFVTEALHLAALVGAILATIIGFPFIEPWLVETIGYPIIVKIVGNAATFLIVLALLRFIANFIGQKVRQSEVGIIDRSFGAIFGLLRGFLIVVFMYVLFVRIVQPDEEPDFIRHAKLGSFITHAATMIDPYIDGDKVQEIVDKARGALPAPSQNEQKEKKSGSSINTTKPVQNISEETDQTGQGYDKNEREALEDAFNDVMDAGIDSVLERMRGEGETETNAKNKTEKTTDN